MDKVVSVIGIDISKRYFQLHGATAEGEPVLRRKLTRSKLLGFLARQPDCRVVMEACASAHHWGRMIRELGHEVRLIPPVYVKPYVKRQKNDANDAEAIVEAAQPPTMRFVAVRTEAEQACRPGRRSGGRSPAWRRRAGAVRGGGVRRRFGCGPPRPRWCRVRRQWPGRGGFPGVGRP